MSKVPEYKDRAGGPKVRKPASADRYKKFMSGSADGTEMLDAIDAVAALARACGIQRIYDFGAALPAFDDVFDSEEV